MTAQLSSVSHATGDDMPLDQRLTSWRQTGRTGVIALGQKTWTPSVGDLSLFELATCEFGDGVTHREPTQQGKADGRA